jgi:hypothetical protein
LIEYNEVSDTIAIKPIHPDIIQFFAARNGGGIPTRITIRRNHLHDPGVVGTVPGQGVFVSDPGNEIFQYILIEENLINTAGQYSGDRSKN